MYHSILLAFEVSSLFLGNILAAPAAPPAMARFITPSPVTSLPPTSTTSDASTSTITALAGEKRQGNIHDLDALVFPQFISSTPTSSAASSTFVFEVAHQVKARAIDRPVKSAAKALRKAPSNQGSSFGPLAELSFPQAISSSATASSTQTGFEISETNRAAILGD